MRFVTLAVVAVLTTAGDLDALTTRTLALAANDLAYSPLTGRLYASVPGTNRVVEIDPATNTVGRQVFVGSDPNRLAISDDGQFLYVGLDGAGTVTRVFLPTMVAEPPFALGSDYYHGPYFVEDMAVQPGNPNVVAVSLRYTSVSPKHAGVAIYENGVARAQKTPGHTGSNVIEFGASGARLYGLNTETTESGFRRMSVDQTGVTVVDATSGLIRATDFEYDAGRLYAATGRVIDGEGRTLAGTFTGLTFGSYFVEPDSEAGVVYFLARPLNSSTWELRPFNIDEFTPLPVTAIPGVVGDPRNLIRWGDDGLAFCTSGGQVILIDLQSAPETNYLAEGATSAFLNTRFALLNPGATDTWATLTFARAGTTPITHVVPVPAHTRKTVDAKSVSGMTAAEFSTKVESSKPVIVDRTMSWDASGYGAHAETAVAAPSPIWYLAEGATHSGFDLFYLLQNPATTETDVRVRYLRPSGAPLEKVYTLPPNSRTTIWANVETFPGLGLALASTDVSAVVESLDNTPIIVERAVYLSNQGRTFNAGHASAGVTAPHLQWFMAEGATGDYFDLFVLVANPNDLAATLQLTYLLTDGRTFTRTLTAPANSRSTIWVDQEQFDGVPGQPLADVAVSTTIESLNNVPVIVERALWWPGEFGTWHEAHNSAGATSTGTAWALAEGEVNGGRGEETYILIANTSAYAGQARVTLFFEDGTSAQQTYALPARSRSNVAVGPDFGAIASGRRFGAVVESLGTTPAQIVVERAMYWNAGGVGWAAGTNALATKLR